MGKIHAEPDAVILVLVEFVAGTGYWMAALAAIEQFGDQAHFALPRLRAIVETSSDEHLQARLRRLVKTISAGQADLLAIPRADAEHEANLER